VATRQDLVLEKPKGKTNGPGDGMKSLLVRGYENAGVPRGYRGRGKKTVKNELGGKEII